MKTTLTENKKLKILAAIADNYLFEKLNQKLAATANFFLLVKEL